MMMRCKGPAELPPPLRASEAMLRNAWSSGCLMSHWTM
jgi:hypothetical protein